MSNWWYENKMILNINKCRYITYNRKESSIYFNYIIKEEELERLITMS